MSARKCKRPCGRCDAAVAIVEKPLAVSASAEWKRSRYLVEAAFDAAVNEDFDELRARELGASFRRCGE